MVTILLIAFALLAIGDIWTTARALKLGGAEASPLPALLFKHLPPVAVMVVLKIAGLAFLWYVSNVRTDGAWWHGPTIWTLTAALFAGAFYVLVSNLRFIRRS